MQSMLRFLRDASLTLALLIFSAVPFAQAQDLSSGDAEYLDSLDGLMFIDAFGETDTYEEVEAQFVDTLVIHIDEFGPGDERAFLLDYYAMSNLSSYPNVSASVDSAIETFLATDLPLTEAMNEYLLSCESLMTLEAETFSRFETLIYNILDIHKQEFDPSSRTSAEAYLNGYINCPSPTPERIANSIQTALDRFLADNATPEVTSTTDFNSDEVEFLSSCDSLMAFDFEVIQTDSDLEDFLFEILDIHRSEFDETSTDSALNYLYEYTSCSRPFPSNVQRLEAFFSNAAGRLVSQILSGDLTVKEKRFLSNCDSLMALDDVRNIDEFKARLVEILKIHIGEFDETDRSAIDQYLREYTSCVRPADSQRLENIFVNAVDQFMAGLAPEPEPEADVNCPDCDLLKRELMALETEYSTKHQQARETAATFKNLRERLNTALDGVIEGVDGCENERDVDFTGASSTATGLVYGRPFSCNSNDAVTRMTEALNSFWRSHNGSQLDQDLESAEDRLEKLEKALRMLTQQIKDKKAELERCVAAARIIEACKAAVEGALEGIDRVIPEFSYDVPTSVDFEISFAERNVQKGVEFAETFRSVAPAILEISRFQDLKDMPQRVLTAIRDLSNRVPIFKGNEGGETFGADEISARAIIATVLYRIGQQAGLPGYQNIVIDYSLRPDDVPAGIWYEDAMIHAIMMGIFIPQDGTVRPSDPVNWAELATIIRRWADFTPISPAVAPFPQVAVGEWYTQEIHTLKQLGLLSDFNAINPAGLPKKFELVLVTHNLIGLSGIFLDLTQVTAAGNFSIAISDIDTSNLSNKKLEEVTLDDAKNGTVNAQGEIIVPFKITPTNTNDENYGNLIELVTSEGLMFRDNGVSIRVPNGGTFSSDRRAHNQVLDLNLIISNEESLFRDRDNDGDREGGVIKFNGTNELNQTLSVELKVGVQ